MQSPGREPSMEDILASIKKVIAEEKEQRQSVPSADELEDAPLPEEESGESEDGDVLELNEPLAPAIDLGPPLIDDSVAGHSRQADVLELNEPLAPAIDLGPPLIDDSVAGHSRQALEELQTIAATVPPAPQVNPLEDMVREMLRPILKQWLDEHLPGMVDEHVKREITRITGRPL